MENEAALIGEAEIIDQQLRRIRRALVRAYDEDKSRANLTAPQLQAMAILAEAHQSDRDGLTVLDLSQHMGLAQSTVSGIVERLERKNFIRREPDPEDRRRTRIVLTEGVKVYLEQAVFERRLKPLIDALGRASDEERHIITEGMAILNRLLVGKSG